MSEPSKNVSDKEVFFLADGRTIKNLDELLTVIKTIKLETYAHHVNSTMNDFREWVLHAVGDRVLAAQLSNGISKERMQEIIANHLHGRKKEIGSSHKTTASITQHHETYKDNNDEHPIHLDVLSNVHIPHFKNHMWKKDLTKMFILGALFGLLVGLLIGRIIF